MGVNMLGLLRRLRLTKGPKLWRETQMDSILTEEDLRQHKEQNNESVEQFLQELARARYDVSIRASVFQRVAPEGKGSSYLAMLRPNEKIDAADARLNEGIALQIVTCYNRDHRPFRTPAIGCVVWSATPKFAPQIPTPASIILQSGY